MPRPAARLTTARFAELLLVGLILVLLGDRFLGGDDGAPPPASTELTLRLDLNRAGWHELVCLPGIGEARAREIVRDRGERGSFAGPEDLDRVKGIGPKTIRKVRDFLRE
jgi:competence ComEA-like helix-hairpin-helix protein